MKFQLLLLSLLFTSISANSQKYKIEKEPDWIKTIGIPDKSEVKKYDVSSGYYLALADYQVNLETNASYSHNVTNVVSYSGVTKASQLSISYDTAYQQLKIHHLYIWRNGEKIDRTSNLSFKTLNNEFNLHNGIYTGLITSYCNLNDIRKDDLIDFAYTLVGKNPIFKNEKYLFIPLETDNPVDLYSIRILYSKNKDYEYRCVGTDSSSLIASSVVGNYRELDINIPLLSVACVILFGEASSLRRVGSKALPLLSVACIVLFGEASSLHRVGSKALPCILKLNMRL